MRSLSAVWMLLLVMPLAIVLAFIGRALLGMLRAYYILRVRAGLPVVLWLPKFWSMDGRRQTGSSLSRVLERMQSLGGPHGMYGTVFGTQAVLHVADPEAAALVLSQHTKSPGYDHFRAFFGRGVFTADGEEWRRKRASVAHAMFRGNSSRGGGDGDGRTAGLSLVALANEEADSVLRDVEAMVRGGEDRDGEVEVEIVYLLQRHTLNLIHRFLCGGDHVASSPERKRLVKRYLNAVTDMRMVILARSRSIWMFAGGWIYRAFSPLHARETRNMKPIREMAKLILEAATFGNDPARRSSEGHSEDRRRGVVGVSFDGSRSESGRAAGWGGRVGRASTLSGPGGLLYSCKNLGRTCARVALQGLSMALKVGLERGEEERNDENGDRGRDAGKLAGGNGATLLGIVERDGETAAAAAAAAAPEPTGGRVETSNSSSNGSDVTGRIKKTERGRPTAVAVLRRENTIDRQGREDDRGTATRSAARRTALAEMAGRESHRGHDHHHDYRDSMADETITLLFAGQDTTAATLSWAMHLLSLPQNRGYLIEVRREAAAAAKVSDGGGGASESKRCLPMLDACIREAQRLYPVAPFVVRHLRSDLRLKDGTLLPAGALACVWIYGLHRHPALWENPEVFLPRRWLDEAKQPAGAFIPYASGPRGCVGRPFATVVLRTILARLCLALDFSPAVAAMVQDEGFPDAVAVRQGGGNGDGDGGDYGCAARTTRRDWEGARGSASPSRTSKSESAAGGGGGVVVTGGSLPSLGRERSGKEMQAGFTVLPRGGVHLRLRLWPKGSMES